MHEDIHIGSDIHPVDAYGHVRAFKGAYGGDIFRAPWRISNQLDIHHIAGFLVVMVSVRPVSGENKRNRDFRDFR